MHTNSVWKAQLVDDVAKVVCVRLEDSTTQEVQAPLDRTEALQELQQYQQQQAAHFAKASETILNENRLLRERLAQMLLFIKTIPPEQSHNPFTGQASQPTSIPTRFAQMCDVDGNCPSFPKPTPRLRGGPMCDVDGKCPSCRQPTPRLRGGLSPQDSPPCGVTLSQSNSTSCGSMDDASTGSDTSDSPRDFGGNGTSASSSSSASTADATSTVSFRLTLRRLEGHPLGIIAKPDSETESLLVQEVQIGSVAGSWNQMNTGELREIRAGDRIVEINGLRDPEAMRAECRGKLLLKIVVERNENEGSDREWQHFANSRVQKPNGVKKVRHAPGSIMASV